jgi:hypothetical protein
MFEDFIREKRYLSNLSEKTLTRTYDIFREELYYSRTPFCRSEIKDLRPLPIITAMRGYCCGSGGL